MSSSTPCPSGDKACCERILAAARELFAVHGYAGASMQEIAGFAGVSKSNLFHHFGNKKGLYLAVLRQAANHFGEELRPLTRSDEPVETRIAGFMRGHLAHILEREAVSHLILGEIMSRDPESGRTLATDVFHENFQMIVDLLRDGQAQGLLRNDIHAEHAALLLIGADIFYFLAHNVMRHTPGVEFGDSPDLYAATATDVLLNGLKPRN